MPRDSYYGVLVLTLSQSILGTQISQAATILANTFQAVATQKIDSDEGGFPGGFLENGDRFGRSVISIGDLDLDGVKDLVVGARSDDDGGEDAGAAYILFMNPDLTVKSTTKISATTGGLGAGVLDAGDFFGYSLASPGDLNNDGIQDLTVGAPNDDDGSVDAGAIYNLFLDRTGAVQSFQKISNIIGGLTPGNQGSPLSEGDFFGTAAGAIGDYNNDGFVDIAIGAPRDDDGGTNQGAVWLLSLEQGGAVASTTKISDPDLPFGTLSSRDEFGGRHVANIGDLDGDGRDELAVGAYLDDDGGADAGALYTLFFNDDLTIRDVQKISALEGGLTASLSDDDLFGMTVAPLGDLDGDGIPDIAVGSNKDDDGGEDRGALFFFLMNSDGTVKSEAKISSADNFGFDSLELTDGARFGRALGFVGDLAGDGSQVLAVGAGAGVDGGAVWLLKFRTQAVPEPSAIMLVLVGLVCRQARRRA
ncbi:FG-GAP-like repeat-containing protein [Botrimarina hoheduenensis]|uniref:FG-GAP repeat protein n=1 Tax=Botrimarina hoheduenensis TaxID=2528000 RepID=A0A5C5WA35_9BACT|nr:FG-GAP-like repeat-containing protein [Botrimarina hoheduenensis]TWT46891.1 FG-GAP repeat protein [Botrimarina hoheduenensis]